MTAKAKSGSPAMGLIIFPTILVPTLLAFVSIGEIWKIELPLDLELILSFAGSLTYASIATYLILWRFNAEATFQWLFFSGLLLLALALAQIFAIFSLIEARYGINGPTAGPEYILMPNILIIGINVLYGSSLLAVAAVQNRLRK